MQVIGFNGYGQTYDSLAVDGQIFVKIKDTSNVFFQNYNGNDSTLRPEILSLKNTYGISKISKPFSNYNYSYCQKTYLLEFSNYTLVQGLINDLTLIGYIEYAENIPIVFTFITPSDPQFNGGVLNAQNWHLKKIGAEQAWDISTGNASTIIAVIDNEIDISHPDLANKIVSPSDQADNDSDPSPNATLNHGSHVAGLVAAESNNILASGSIASIGYNCSIMPIKATSSLPNTLVNSLSLAACINGINYAVTNGANIINCSWGIYNANITLQNACINATNNNVLIVAATPDNGGSFTPPFFPVIGFPAGFSTTNNGIISVAATNNNDVKAGFSFYGASVTVCAPGENIFSTNSLQQITTIPGFDYKSGTSMAAPIVAGLCGLIHSINPSLTPSQIRDCITNTATNIDALNPQFVGLIGSGRINAPQALLCASNAQNNTASIIASSTTACSNQQITLTGFPLGANSYNWSFSQIPTIISQIGNQIIVTFPNNGIVNVTLTVNTASGTLTANQLITIGSPFVDFDQRASGAICNGSAQQLDLNFFNTTPPYNYTISNGVTTTSITNATTLQQNYFFNASMANNVYTVTVTDVNGCTAQPTISINNIVSCCQNLVINGDFEQGNIAFQSDNIFSICPLPINTCRYGAYQIIDLSSLVFPNTFLCNSPGIGISPELIGINIGVYNSLRNSMLRIDGRCGPDQTPIGQVNLAPLTSNTDGFNGYHFGESSNLWSQNNILVNSNNTYNLDFFMSTDGGSAYFSNLVNIEIIDQTNLNILFTSNNFVIPSTNLWNQFSYQFQPNINGNIIIRINQVEYFGASYFDMNIDDVSLRATTNTNTLSLAISNNCIANNATSSITPTTNVVNPLYQLNGVATTPPFVVPIGTYTISVVNDPLCPAVQVQSIFGIPTITANASQTTICSGQSIILTGSGGNTYVWSGGAVNGTPYTPPVGVTTYTVTGTDVNGCTSTSFITINVNPSPLLSATATPSTICIGSSSNLLATGATNYTWQPGGMNIANPTVTPNTTTTYTVTGSLGNNCTATSTVTVSVINNLPTPTWTLSSPCVQNISPVSLLVSAPIGAGIQYQLNGGVPQSSTLFSNISSAGNYTITATLNGNCTSSAVASIPSCNIPCAALAANPNTVYIFANSTATTIWPANNFPATVPVVFDGIFTVNQNLNMLNNQNIFFTANSQVLLTNGSTLTIDNSKLQSCGVAMWTGIFADQANETIVMQNASELREAALGVCIYNNAMLHTTGTRFVDNGSQGILFQNINLNNYTATIKQNEFTSNGISLLPPYNTLTRTKTGISTRDVSNLTIGDLSNAANGNDFSVLFNGISSYINNPSFASSIIDIGNNNFTNIVNGGTDYTKTQQKYTNLLGTAIWGMNNSNTVNTTFRIMNTAGNVANKKFLNCDKGIVLQKINAQEYNLSMENVLMGSMHNAPITRSYRILNNKMENVFHGIEILGKNHILNVNDNNIISTVDWIQVYPNAWTNRKAIYPIGINVDNFNSTLVNTSSYNNKVDRDTINIRCIGGTGIRAANWNDAFESIDNIINFTTNSTYSAGFFSGMTPNINTDPWAQQFRKPELYGYLISSSQLSLIKHNYINGPDKAINIAVFNARRSSGIFVSNSQKVKYDCNQLNNTWFGMSVLGNCGTASDFCRGNFFNQHKEGISLRREGGVDGTLNDIGSFTYDCNNNWSGTYNLLLNNVTLSYQFSKIRRYTNSLSANSPNNRIYTTNTTINDFESFPDGLSNLYRYQKWLTNLNAAQYKDGCMSPVIYTPQVAQYMPVVDMDEALAIANDSIVYISNGDVEAFRDELRLYESLAQDTALRNSDATLQLFYASRSGTDVADVYNTNDQFLWLSDTLLNTDSLYIEQALQAIETSNGDIQSMQDYVMNEHDINEIYLKYTRLGIDSLNAADSLYIDNLAKQCPAIAGNAVYKARMLFNLWNSIDNWDDQYICALNGLAKNASNWVEDERALQDENNDGTQPTGGLGSIGKEDILLYPNPTTGKINVQYQLANNQQASINILNSMGQIIQTIYLDATTNHIQFELFNVSSGIYYYEYFVNNKSLKTGKITLMP